MLTIPFPLPLLRASSAPDGNGRAFRRELTILVERHAGRGALGDRFSSLTVPVHDREGDPLELGFCFTGSDRRGLEKEVAVFMRGLVVAVRSGKSELRRHSASIVRPLAPFRPPSVDAARWREQGIAELQRIASRRALGELFIRVDADSIGQGMPATDIVTFTFATYRNQDHAVRIDAFGEVVRSSASLPV